MRAIRHVSQLQSLWAGDVGNYKWGGRQPVRRRRGDVHGDMTSVVLRVNWPGQSQDSSDCFAWSDDSAAVDANLVPIPLCKVLMSAPMFCILLSLFLLDLAVAFCACCWVVCQTMQLRALLCICKTMATNLDRFLMQLSAMPFYN